MNDDTPVSSGPEPSGGQPSASSGRLPPDAFERPPAVSSGRVRVTAQPRAVRPVSRTPVDAGPTEASALYLRTLIRAQLRLGITLAVGFAITLGLASVAVASTPILHTATIGGVPWAWALQAFGMYPIVVVFALLYVRAARRNEQRYRSLESPR